MQQSSEAFCASLRTLVKDATEKRWPKAAVFYADKLVTLSTTAGDLYLFAQALHDNGEYRRAVSLLRSHRLTLRNFKFACLVGRCLLGCKAYEECLLTIGGEDEASEPDIPVDATVDCMASLYVIRARAWEALENPKLAVVWYKKALKTDPFCYEAFHSLMSRNMLSQKDEQKLLASLPCDCQVAWIKTLYTCLCSKYTESFEDKLKDVKEIILPESTVPLRPSDQANRGQLSLGDSSHPSSSYLEQSTNSEVEGAVVPRAGLESNTDVNLAHAEWHYCRGANTQAYIITSKLLKDTPEATHVYPVHLAACFELDMKSELYLKGQELSKLVPDSALSQYAFGVYYMAVKNYSEARKAFARSNSVDRYFAPAWIGLGNAYAAQAETDQALAAYRTSQSLFPGLHLPSMYIGMESLRLNMLDSAKVDFETAYQLCPGDPMPMHQLGVVEYLKGNYTSAGENFARALQKIPCKEAGTNWEAIHLNLGHALRKQKRFADALDCYQKALKFHPRQSGTHTAIGFVYHLQNELTKAIDSYQTALTYDEHDTFAREMLEAAARENLGLPYDLFEL